MIYFIFCRGGNRLRLSLEDNEIKLVLHTFITYKSIGLKITGMRNEELDLPQ